MESGLSLEKLYDIIIQKVIEGKEMEQQGSLEDVIYSKSAIRKAGKVLARAKQQDVGYNAALEVLDSWRAAHALPMNLVTEKLKRENPGAVVVNRLKRLDSVVGKLQRFPNMDLYRMQDLGGCRVILDSVGQVGDAVMEYKNNNDNIKKENDYIRNPKPSGYRSHHLVCQFDCAPDKEIPIEIQFRTRLQHLWATAVEMMAIYTASNLKSGVGAGYVLRFFVLASSVFAIKECMPVCPDTSSDLAVLLDELKGIDDRHHIMDTLVSLNAAVEYTETKIQLGRGYQYYLLFLDYENHRLRIQPFFRDGLARAARAYIEIEGHIAKHGNVANVVLVSACSFDELREAYPNYFVDIREFINVMHEMWGLRAGSPRTASLNLF